ncbi:MAG: hypothetical protein JSS57_13485 [Proteobacteria bacterium]|nr:hypothetical protein [Pseudomonadota bacterium]
MPGGVTDFGEIISHVCASTGWTWDYVAEHVDLPRLEALNAYWADHPPLHVMVAAYLDIKPQPKQDAELDLLAVYAQFPQNRS